VTETDAEPEYTSEELAELRVSRMYMLLGDMVPFVPPMSEVRDLFYKYNNLDVAAIFKRIKRHPRYVEYLEMLQDACKGVEPSEIEKAFIAFISNSYPDLLNEIMGSDRDGILLTNMVVKAVDEVVT